MTKLDQIDFQRIFTAAAGAFVLGAACVVGAVGPARAAETGPVAAWRANVERQIDANMQMPASALEDGGHAVATVSVRFDAQGGFDGASLVHSTGSAALDHEALRTARSINYPALPVAKRDVAMQLYFGEAAPARSEVRREANTALTGYDKGQRIETASLPQG